MFNRRSKGSKKVPFNIRHYASISENFDHSTAAEGIAITALFLIIVGGITWWFFDGRFSLLILFLMGTTLLGAISLVSQMVRLFKSLWKK